MPKPLTDAKLIALAKEYKKAQEAEAEAKAEKEKVKGPIVTEMKRRGIKAIEKAGVRLNLALPTYTVYNMIKMRRVLGKELFAKVTKRVVDTDALEAAINSGKVTPKMLAKFATQEEKSAYPTVSFIPGGE